MYALPPSACAPGSHDLRHEHRAQHAAGHDDVHGVRQPVGHRERVGAGRSHDADRRGDDDRLHEPEDARHDGAGCEERARAADAIGVSHGRVPSGRRRRSRGRRRPTHGPRPRVRRLQDLQRPGRVRRPPLPHAPRRRLRVLRLPRRARPPLPPCPPRAHGDDGGCCARRRCRTRGPRSRRGRRLRGPPSRPARWRGSRPECRPVRPVGDVSDTSRVTSPLPTPAATGTRTVDRDCGSTVCSTRSSTMRRPFDGDTSTTTVTG